MMLSRLHRSAARRRRALPALLVPMLLLLAACSAPPQRAQAPEPAVAGTSTPEAADAAMPVDQGVHQPTAVAPGSAGEGTVLEPLAPASGRTRNGEVNDPWEPFNRRVHNFNLHVDEYIARPLARGYRAVTPQPVRTGIGNFFTNLYEPITAVNLVLQGRPRQAVNSLARFTLNLTLGLGGFLDPASDAKLRQHNEDFGQTMAVWGWDESRYLVLPFLGPSTVRDGFGRLGDRPLNPLNEVSPARDRFLIQGVGLVDLRATLMDLGELEAGSGDSYTLFRDTFLQRRRFLIGSDEDQLPDYLFDEDFLDDDMDWDTD